jgi:hypothetical protein
MNCRHDTSLTNLHAQGRNDILPNVGIVEVGQSGPGTSLLKFSNLFLPENSVYYMSDRDSLQVKLA